MLAQSNKFYLLVILHGGDLRESPSTELTTVRLLSCVTPHMALQTRGLKMVTLIRITNLIPGIQSAESYLVISHLEEPFSTLVAEMGALIVVLFPGWMDKHDSPSSAKQVLLIFQSFF